MALDKNDFKQIEKIFDKRLISTEKTLEKKIEDEVGSLARMAAGEFSSIHKKLDKNEQDHQSFKKDFADIRFRMAELVYRNEFLELVERVEKLEVQKAR